MPAKSGAAQIARQPQRHDNPDIWLQRRQTLLDLKIEMVIMRMRADKDIDFRQGIGGVDRRHHTFWATETERRRAVQ